DEAAPNPDAVLELGPSRLARPGTERPDQRGTVRVVTTPRGARVYQLIGFSPDVKVEHLPLGSSHELLVYREGFRPEIRTLSPSDFHDQGGRRIAELSVTLSKR